MTKKEYKEFKLKGIQGWIDSKFRNSGHGIYTLSKLMENGVDLEKELNKMTFNQLSILLSFIATSYGLGADDQRKWKESYRIDQERYKKQSLQRSKKSSRKKRVLGFSQDPDTRS